MIGGSTLGRAQYRKCDNYDRDALVVIAVDGLKFKVQT